jgi:hypothetical protein
MSEERTEQEAHPLRASDGSISRLSSLALNQSQGETRRQPTYDNVDPIVGAS